MEADDPRTALDALCRARGEDYAGLSRLVGRNPAYIQQYIKRGSPRSLPERERRTLAAYFVVPESLLGGPPPPPASRFVALPRYRVAASAGPGAVADEGAPGRVQLDAAWLRELGAAAPGDLSLIRVEGASMEPTLADGDEIIVDASATRAPLADGVWVLRLDDTLLVKRLALHADGRVAVLSDNPAFPPLGPFEPSALTPIGRVLWAGGRVR